MYVSIILVIIIIIGMISLLYVITYNDLVSYKIRIEKAEGIIDEKLREKYDLIAKMNINIKKVVNIHQQFGAVLLILLELTILIH